MTGRELPGGDRTGRELLRKPRKVIVATTILDTYDSPYPGVVGRLEEIEALLARAGEISRNRYDGRSPDLCILPEDVLGNKDVESIAERSFSPEGPEVERIALAARRLRSYVVLPFVSVRRGVYRNGAVLLDRAGRCVGEYHKAFPVLDGKASGSDSSGSGPPNSDPPNSDPPDGYPPTFEGGVTPGSAFPVFECDFGRLGIQICFDIAFDPGWTALAGGGAELVAWPTESPQVRKPCCRAEEGDYYIVSATTRLNASIFDPSGSLFASVSPPEQVLVEEIDLSYTVLNWSLPLRDGAAFDEKYGTRAGYRYYETEDRGIFWSNDPDTPIDAMVSELALEPRSRQLKRFASAVGRQR